MGKHFKHVIGLDISPSMVQLSRDYLHNYPSREVRLCDGQTFPVEDASVDFVYSVICFQHIPYRDMIQRYIAESYRVLKPGGLIRVQTHKGQPCTTFSGMYGHYYPSLEAFAREFKYAGFTAQECEEIGDYLWVTGEKE
jgi:ubiquinone/menaquinone biosynthesis C-methylase UbiE